MIDGIRDFFTQMIAPAASQAGAGPQHALHVATAALLLEMMRMDSSVTDAETATVAQALQTRFGLCAQEVDTLMALATEEAKQATDYFQFTSLINKHFSREQKIEVVENLWQVAFADGHLDAHEQHFMRKIADLLYVSQADYVGAKQRARDKG
ncbi:MAG: TerB family tellurite resistance protein [Betaproteobacteria bacterium]|nr:TerB family tellurite resistance protein [Betaproteobacteria bacterium]